MTDEKNSVWWQKSVEIFSRLSVWIAAPVMIGSFLGKWLDKKFNTEPFLFITTMGLMFILSMFGLIKETMKEFKNLDKNLDKKDEDKK